MRGRPQRSNDPVSRDFRCGEIGPEVWRVLARCHDVRNLGEYEGDADVDERLLADLIKACKIVAAALRKPTI